MPGRGGRDQHRRGVTRGPELGLGVGQLVVVALPRSGVHSSLSLPSHMLSSFFAFAISQAFSCSHEGNSQLLLYLTLARSLSQVRFDPQFLIFLYSCLVKFVQTQRPGEASSREKGCQGLCVSDRFFCCVVPDGWKFNSSNFH